MTEPVDCSKGGYAVPFHPSELEAGDEFPQVIALAQLLFFTALSNARNADWGKVRYALEPRIGNVPFLNGGLFTEQDFDKRPGGVVPNEAIRLILRDLFAQFNFTVTESTPYDQEVAVDPEMLGKVFEELVTGRHETGSYYTPRPVVSFMCREALKGYLCSEVTGLSGEAVSRFVDEHQVDKLSLRQAPRVLAALEQVTSLDPACESGAYLLGMLHELVELQQSLYSSDLIQDSKTLYELKLRVIEQNVYGADIDPFAVNVAMLRLWLSLAIEYDGKTPEPLPNLKFKIVCGDSLSAPDPTPGKETDLFRLQVHKDADELARLKSAYMRKTGEEKNEAERLIAAKRGELQKMLAHAPAAERRSRLALRRRLCTESRSFWSAGATPRNSTSQGVRSFGSCASWSSTTAAHG
ncbi:MAG: hypothetical protein JOZ87_14045 [Chloroflexi bacterium]|nr:hypothetical protein [Chloroflexota bacterium]